MSEVRERNGDMVDVDENVEPVHHWRCNGRGFTRASDVLGPGAAVACGVCRPRVRVLPEQVAPVRRPLVLVR